MKLTDRRIGLLAAVSPVLAALIGGFFLMCRSDQGTIGIEGDDNVVVSGDDNEVVINEGVPPEIVREMVRDANLEAALRAKVAENYPLGYSIYHSDGSRTVVDPSLPNLDWVLSGLEVEGIGDEAIRVRFPDQIKAGDLYLGGGDVQVPDFYTAKLPGASISLCKREGYRRYIIGDDMAWIGLVGAPFAIWLEVLSVKESVARKRPSASVVLGVRKPEDAEGFPTRSFPELCRYSP